MCLRLTEGFQLLQRDVELQKLGEERNELRAMVEDRDREALKLSRARETLEADLALCQEKLHTAHFEVRVKKLKC